MRPLPLIPDWEQFVRDNYQNAVYALIQPAENVDFGDGPAVIQADYLPDVGTFLTVTGTVDYDDSRKVRMRAGYMIRWDYPGLTNASDTPWKIRWSGVIDKKPAPPPETQPAPATLPAQP